MSLVWGVRAFIKGDHDSMDDAIQYSIDFLKEKKLIKEGDIVVHVGSTPYKDKGQTNMIKISYV
jgi:pyruvate kinase